MRWLLRPLSVSSSTQRSSRWWREFAGSGSIRSSKRLSARILRCITRRKSGRRRGSLRPPVALRLSCSWKRISPNLQNMYRIPYRRWWKRQCLSSAPIRTEKWFLSDLAQAKSSNTNCQKRRARSIRSYRLRSCRRFWMPAISKWVLWKRHRWITRLSTAVSLQRAAGLHRALQTSPRNMG